MSDRQTPLPRLAFLATLEDIVRERVDRPVAGSYVGELVREGVRRQAQKVGEEAVELAIAACAGSRKEQIEEAADLLFHLIVLLTANGSSLAEVVAALERRHPAGTDRPG